MVERDFKGVWIPKEIWCNEKMSLQEKVFFIEIDSLDNEEGCFAGNDHFAKFFFLSKKRVSVIINELVKKGYLTSEIIYKGKEIDKRILRVSPKARIPHQQSKDTPTPVNEEDSNTVSINNTSNIYTALFEKFFSLYPEGGQTLKPQTFKNFQALIKKKVNPEDLMQAARNYATDCIVSETVEPYFKKSSNFVGREATYLNYTDREWIPVIPKQQAKREKTIAEKAKELAEDYAIRHGITTNSPNQGYISLIKG